MNQSDIKNKLHSEDCPPSRRRGRPRKYLTEEEAKEAWRANVNKNNKKHRDAEKIKEYNKYQYIKRTYLAHEPTVKYNTAYNQMYGTAGCGSCATGIST